MPSEKIAVTLGDPAGIGPEVTLKALAARKIPGILLLGRAAFFEKLARRLSLHLSFRDLSHPDEQPPASRIPCYFDEAFPPRITLGRSDKRLTTLAVRSIEWAARLALKGKVDAIVTPPINKAGLQKAGFKIPGHTEFLAELSRVKNFEMMLVGGNLRVVLVTRHVPLKAVSAGISKERVIAAIRLAALELRRSFGIRRPRLVVCGLNPHAGEEGHLGSEEIDVIAPAVRKARKMVQAEIAGPLAPDALFHDAYTGKYDAEICMYHDQGLIPLKMISRGSGVNVTLGLPFVRTSPDHGTGYDIAARFTANAGSMTAALELAARLARNRKAYARTHPTG